MTYEQYWQGDVWAIVAYRQADRHRVERTNAEAHLMGMYVYEALCDVSPVLHAFAKRGTNPLPFRERPYSLSGSREADEQEKARQEENDRLRARIYMDQMMRAGKNWGKGGK